MCIRDRQSTASLPPPRWSPQQAAHSGTSPLSIALSLGIHALQCAPCLARGEVGQVIVVRCNVDEPLPLYIRDSADIVTAGEHKLVVQDPTKRAEQSRADIAAELTDDHSHHHTASALRQPLQLANTITTLGPSRPLYTPDADD